MGVSAASLVVRHDRPPPPPSDGNVQLLKRLCETHQYLQVVELAEGVLAQPSSPRAEAFAHHYLGLALVRMDRPDQALSHLREARALFELLNDPWFIAETLDWEAGALHRMEDVGALELEIEALRWYRALEPRLPDTEARMLEHLGTVFAGKREYDRALACWQEAIAMPVVREFVRMGRIYHGVGLCHSQLGDYERALEALQTALVLYSQEHDLSPVPQSGWVANVENELALVFMKLGQLGRADEFLRSALEHSAQSGTERVKSHYLLSLGELRAMQSRGDEAFIVVGEAIALAEALGEVLSVQKGYQQLGELHAGRGEHALADENFERAAALLREAGYAERLEECLQAWEAVRQSRRELDANNR
jgi:tetratricopeptide (TPR) repeat protein